MNKTFSLMLAGIFVLVLLLGIGSSAITLFPQSYSSNVTHDSTFNFDFKIQADANWKFYNMSIVKTDLGTIQAGNITISNLKNISAGTNDTITVTITIPKGTSPGIYNSTLTIDGKEENSTNSSEIRPLWGSETFDVSLNVMESPKLTISQPSLTKTSNGTITITNEGNVDLTNIDFVKTANADFTVSFNESKFTLTPGQSKVVLIYSKDVERLEFGEDNEYEFKVVSEQFNSSEIKLTVPMNYCEDCVNEGRLDIKDLGFETIEGFGDDENYWYPLDTIEASFDIENNGNWDIEDVVIEWAIYTENGVRIMDGEEDEFNLDRNDEINNYKIRFKLEDNIEDFDGNDAVFYVKAVGKIDDRDSIYDGNETGEGISEIIDIKSESNFVLAENIRANELLFEEGFVNSTFYCNSEVSFKGELWNIGSRDQDDGVYLIAYNTELGFYKEIYLDEVNSYDVEDFSFTLGLSKELEEKYYPIYFEVRDEDKDVYENREDDLSKKVVYLEVKDCGIDRPTLKTTELVNEAKAGKEMSISMELNNPTESSMTLAFVSEGNEEWTESLNSEPNSLVLLPGETKKVLLNYNLNRDSEGEHIFTVKAINQDGETVLEKVVSVNVEKPNILDVDKQKAKVAGIIALNVILAILIILVLVRIFRRR